MTKQSLSLRDIGRKLDIPPSTVVYYKDRFGRYIPHAGGEGRRRRYPQQAVAVFKEIREMFNQSWSTEQIEQALSKKFTDFSPDDVDETPSPAPGRAANQASTHNADAPIAQAFSQALDKIAELLRNQTQVAVEIESLKRELGQVKAERDQSVDRLAGAVEAMRREVEALRLDRDELAKRVARIQADVPFPAPEFLALPLVVKNDKGEYLGVSGKTKAFSIADFIAQAEKNARAAERALSIGWSRTDDAAVLTLASASPESSHTHMLEIEEATTPSGNRTALLRGLTIDDAPVPAPFLLILFRKIKDGFDD